MKITMTAQDAVELFDSLSTACDVNVAAAEKALESVKRKAAEADNAAAKDNRMAFAATISDGIAAAKIAGEGFASMATLLGEISSDAKVTLDDVDIHRFAAVLSQKKE